MNEVLSMKKIICLLLALVCTFAIVSCNKDDTPDTGDQNNNQGANTNNDTTATELEALNAVIAGSKPTQIVTHADYTVSGETLKGRYTTVIDRAANKSQFDFSYQRIAIPGEDISDSHIMTIAGKVYYKDGQISDTEGDVWTSAGVGYLPFSFDFSVNKLDNIEFSNNGDDMTATVSAENAIRVFGTAIDAEGDITISVDTNGEYLYSVMISYTSAEIGATVTVNTTYDYASVALDF